MVGHLDDQLAGGASELHVHVDELHHLAEGQRRGGAVLRRGAGPEQGVRAVDAAAAAKVIGLPPDPKFCDKYHAADPGFWKRVYYWKTPRAPTAANGRATARTTTTGSRHGRRSRDESPIASGLSEASWKQLTRSRQRRRGRWAAGSPTSSTAVPGFRSGRCSAGRSAGWSSAIWDRSRSFWSPRSGASARSAASSVKSFSLDNFKTLVDEPVYRTIAFRTITIAALVTLTDALLAFPIAFYMAKVASRRTKAVLVVAVLMPLWASYLVKVYAWRQMLSTDGVINWALDPLGAHGPGYGNAAVWLVMSYLWLPYMVIPIFAGLERIPNSLISASEDLGASPLHDLPAGDPPARLPRRDRRLDLHLLADARRLHHAAARLQQPVHRQRRLHQRHATTCRLARRSRSFRSPSWSSTC